MPLILFVAFVVTPLVELAVIIQVAGVIELGPTILLLLVDSLIGAYLVRREGRRAWEAFRTALAAGRWPGDEVAQGALVLVGGALLLTPGFVTDLAGLLMVLPPTRRLLSRVLRARLTPVPVQVINTVRGRPDDSRTGSRSDADDGPAIEVVSVERDEPEAVGDASGEDDPPN